ncbi:MAG: zinc ribbon domain-containing protein [Nocardioidaceae bacterium]
MKLLDVQHLDSTRDQLRHRLAHLPEAKRLAELATERADVDGKARDARTRVEDLTRDQRKADADVEQVRTRRQRDRDRMEGGLVNNPKDLEHLQAELVSLERRIAELEDAELEVMEALETAQGELAEHQDRLSEIDATIADTEKLLSEKAGGVDQQVAETEQERRLTAADLPAELLALYDRLREQKGGVGAAALHARQCGGCSLELNAADLAVIARAPSDEVLRCEECNRILVRTSESGL